VAMKPLDADQQAHFDKLIGEARVKARIKAKEEFEAAAGNKGKDAQEALILSRIAEAEKAAREAARAEFEAEAAKAAKKAADDAATAKLVEEKKWKDLANQHSAKLAEQAAELEPLKAKVEAYESLVANMLKDQLEALGDTAKTAVEGLPGEPGDLEKLVWLNQNEGLFEEGGSSVGAVGTPRKKGMTSEGKPASRKSGEGTAPKRVSRWPLKL